MRAIGDIDALQRILAGVAAAAAGLIGGDRCIKMAQPLLREGAAGDRDRGGGVRRGRRVALPLPWCCWSWRRSASALAVVGAAMKPTRSRHARRRISRCCRCSRSAAPWRSFRRCTGRWSRCTRWMTDRQFADLFAIAQVAPGPNIIIVTLIGYQVAGIAGALVATAAMCVPSCVITYLRQPHVRRFKHAMAHRGAGRAGSGLGRAVRGRRLHHRARRRPAIGSRSRSRSRQLRLPIGRGSIRCGCSRRRRARLLSVSCEKPRCSPKAACNPNHEPDSFRAWRYSGKRICLLTCALLSLLMARSGDCARRRDNTRARMRAGGVPGNRGEALCLRDRRTAQSASGLSDQQFNQYAGIALIVDRADWSGAY